jgi:hypothetical protein
MPGRSTYATGSRTRDLAICGLLALFVVVSAPALRVYYRITVVDLTVVRIDPDESRHPLPTPEGIWEPRRRSRLARQRPAAMLRMLEQAIHRFANEDPSMAAVVAGTRFEWTVRYSENTPRLDRHAVIVTRRGAQ